MSFQKQNIQSGRFTGESQNCLDSLKNFHTVCDMFWTVLKISGQSGRFTNSLENFPTVWTRFGKFWDSGKNFWTEDFACTKEFWTFFFFNPDFLEEFPYRMDDFETVWKISDWLKDF